MQMPHPLIRELSLTDLQSPALLVVALSKVDTVGRKEWARLTIRPSGLCPWK